MDGTHRSAIARQKSRGWASHDSFPLGRQSGGRVEEVPTFMQAIRTFPNSSKIPSWNPCQRLSSRCSHD